jgi:hypothetical protein
MKNAAHIGTFKMAILEKIAAACPSFQIGGSISLLEYGVTNTSRPVGDIDIVVSSREEMKQLETVVVSKNYDIQYGFCESDEFGSKTLGDIATPENCSRARLWMGRKELGLVVEVCWVCVFFEQTTDFMTVSAPWGGTVKIQHPRHAITAKRKYVKFLLDAQKEAELTEFQTQKLKKHTSDIAAYEKMLSVTV